MKSFSKRILSIFLTLIIAFSVSLPNFSVDAAEKNIIETRMAQILKEYPHHSAFDSWVNVSNSLIFGGCNGFTGYVTLKIFGSAFYRSSSNYKTVGSASTSSTTSMKKLFAKAKIGDIIVWTKNSSANHYAIFLSDNSEGVKIYEANFGGPNQVWYNHLWPWRHMKDWPGGGADSVSVYRYKNYSKVADGTDNKTIPIGTVFTISKEDNLKIKVIDNSINGGTAVLLSGYKNGIDIPKYFAINYKLNYDTFAIYSKNHTIDYSKPEGWYISSAHLKECDANSKNFFKIVKMPDATKKITATSNSTSIKLSWSKVSSANRYRVYMYDSATKKYKTVKSTTADLNYTVKNLKPGRTYKFKIKAIYRNSNGKLVLSDKTTAITTATDPAKPTLTAKSITKRKANLSWNNVSGESGYQVYYSTKKSSGYKKLDSYKANITKDTATLKSGKTYYFKVRAYKKVGTKYFYSSFSTIKAVKIK